MKIPYVLFGTHQLVVDLRTEDGGEFHRAGQCEHDDQ